MSHQPPIATRECPPWCQIPAGHTWDQAAAGGLLRAHETTRRVPGVSAVELRIIVDETAAAASDDADQAAGPSSWSNPAVWVEILDPLFPAELTTDQARLLAHALLAAAKHADTLTRKDTRP